MVIEQVWTMTINRENETHVSLDNKIGSNKVNMSFYSDAIDPGFNQPGFEVDLSANQAIQLGNMLLTFAHSRKVEATQ